MSTVDHKARHVWGLDDRGRVHCAYMTCNAKPEPAEIAKVEADEALRRATRIEVRWSH